MVIHRPLCKKRHFWINALVALGCFLLPNSVFAAWTVEATIYSFAFSDMVYVATDGTQKKVFLNGDETKEMTTTANPVTISGSCATGLEMDGFYASQTPTIGTDRLIDANGYITATGLALAQTYTGGDFVEWYGACQKTCAVGTYFRTSDKTCATCPDGNVCKGVTVTSNTTDQGKTAAHTITLNNNGGTGGTTKIYALSDGAYLPNSTLMATSGTATRITKPTKSGWTFVGYYRKTTDSGSSYRYINSSGNITSYGNNAAKALTDNATWYARWRLICAAGTYFRVSDGTCQTCPAGSYCAGVTVYSNAMPTTNTGIASCNTGSISGYTSPSGAETVTQCYKTENKPCSELNPISAANNITGATYVSSGEVTCTRNLVSATSAGNCLLTDTTVCNITGVLCDAGYQSTMITSDLTTQSSNPDGSEINYRSNNPNSTYSNTTSFSPGEFQVTFPGPDIGTVHGYSRCSTMGTSYGETTSQNLDNNGDKCWCKIDKFSTYGSASVTKPISSAWVYIDYSDIYYSCEVCAQACAQKIQTNDDNLRTNLYSPSVLTQFACTPRTNTISFNANDATYVGKAQTADVIATYGAAMPTISTTKPVRTGYTFKGWYDNANYTLGTQYYTESGASARTWDKTTNTILYAGWAPKTTDVSFNANGGTGGQSENVTATYGEEMPDIDPTPPTRSGYLFAGWYDTIDTGGTQYYTANGEPANTWWYGNAKKTLFARWEQPVSGAITLNTNGGDTVSPSTVYTKYNVGVYTSQANANAGTNAISALTTVPKKANYRFKGFYTAASGGLPIAAYNGAFFGTASTAVTTAGGTATWYAQYSPLYTVTLNKQEGTGGTNSFYVATDKYVSSDNYGLSELSQVTVPTRTGYTFNGYYSAASDGTQYIDANGNILQALRNAASSATAGFEIYARWTVDTYTVTVVAGNGVSTIAATGWTGSGTRTMTKSYTYGDTINLATVITTTLKAGYNTPGYTNSGYGTLSDATYTVGAGDDTITVAATDINTPTTVTVSPTAVTETYNSNGDIAFTVTDISGNYDSGITVYYQNYIGKYSTSSKTCSSYSKSGTATTSNSFSVAKNAFRGYRCFKVNAYATDGILTSAETESENNLLIYLVQRRLRFYEGSNHTNKYTRYNTQFLYTSTTGNTTTTIPTVSTPEGYTFNGWWTKATGGVQVIDAGGTIKPSVSGYTDASANWILTANKAVYAQWTPNEYTVSFNANGGSGGQTANKTATYDAAMPTISTTPPTKTGYTFDGWYDTSEPTGGTQYYTADGASARTWDKTESTTLYAKWTANKINIVWNGVQTPGTATTFTEVSGESNTYKSQVIYDGDIITPQAAVSSNGQVFKGWRFGADSN